MVGQLEIMDHEIYNFKFFIRKNKIDSKGEIS